MSGNSEAVFEHLVRKCQEAEDGGWAAMSTGEQLATALVLNRPDWLAAAGFTIAEAIERIGPDWLAAVPRAAKALPGKPNSV